MPVPTVPGQFSDQQHIAPHILAWLELQVTRSDVVLTVSETVSDQLRAYLERHAPARAAKLQIGYFHLGSDFDATGHPEADLPPDVSAIFGPSAHVFLMVGSIAPRKNHRFVLDAFDTYWAQGGTAHLVFVGHEAFLTAAFLSYLENHPQNMKRVHHLTRVTDAELETIYRLSAALIMASSAEGFGLPLVEALQRGVPVLCSDIPIFHEVTAGHADFFSLETPDALTALLVDFEARHPPGQPVPRQPKACLSWRESAQIMLRKMNELLEAG